MALRCVFCAVSFVLLAGSAQASPMDYCRAYAIDFADAVPRSSDDWVRRRDDAERACLVQYAPEAPAAKAAKPRVAKAVKPAAKAKPKPEAQVASAPAPAAAPDASVEPAAGPPKKPDLEVGSAAWLDYCDRKYASFDRAKGTYMSRTGVERKCLVTADFQ